jgi:ribonuclease BN (tRNA processing enzyme)
MDVTGGPNDAGSPLAVTILGSSGTYAGPGTACSGYLVRGGGTQVWVDAGPGTLAAVQEHIPLDQLDALVLTHSHPDHWLELPVLRNALRYVLGVKGLPVYGTAETLELAEVLVGNRLAPTFRWTTITEGSGFSVGPLRFSTSVTDHPVETLALRVDHDGRSLGYSADTGAAWSPSGLGADLDLLLCEASLTEDEAGRVQHLTAREAGALAAEAGVARLLLTHLVPGVDPDEQAAAAAAAFGSPVEVARPGETYVI